MTHFNIKFHATPHVRKHHKNRWPGAIAVAFGKRFTNVYSGDGVKFVPGGPYQLSLPPMLQQEWAPGEDEEGLTEQADVLVDPTPPEDDEEDDN